MATGDVRGNFERLKLQLRSISYPHAIDPQGCKEGLPASLLPLIHYALLGYSRHVARYLSVNGYVLYAKSDLRFVECVIKLLRKEFEYRCPLTVAQIFARGFAEKKFLFVHDLIQMCKRKHNDLLRIVRNSQKKPRECQTKAFGRVLHHSQRRPNIRNKHLSSKFDRRCELDLLPGSKCREICSRTACVKEQWVVPEDSTTRLNGVVDNSEEHVRASFERAKEHGLRVLTRSRDSNIDERCHVRHVDSRPAPKFTTATMGAQMIHREYEYGSLSLDQDLGTSPVPSLSFIHDHPPEGNISRDDHPSMCPTIPTSEDDSNTQQINNFEPTSNHGDNHAKMGPLEEIVSSKNEGSQTQTPTMQENVCPCEDQLSGLEDSQAVWQKIMELSRKVDTCFCSLDNKIAHSFNSLDEKLEMKFKYLDEGVTCTRETLQEKLGVLETRIVQLERTTQFSPMSFQSNVTCNHEYTHPIRDITNTFNTNIDNQSWRYVTGPQSREPPIYYPNLFQQQEMQHIEKIPMYAGLLAANTQDFIANVRARFHQTKEMLYQK